MKKKVSFIATALLLFSAVLTVQATGIQKAPPRSFYEIKIYHFTTPQQEAAIDDYLQNAYLPALHSMNIKHIGVFKPVGNDTAADKKVYVLTPYKTLEQFAGLPGQLQKNKEFSSKGAAYLNTAYDKPAYNRYEVILLKAFEYAPQLNVPQLTTPKNQRVYELRSYEGPTEKLYQSKVKMFNQGGETGIFKRLGFNAVFYGEVLSGTKMPNLMYMTSFENKQARDDHWKAFSSDPEWKQLSPQPEYQHTVSHIDIVFLTPAQYSDL